MQVDAHLLFNHLPSLFHPRCTGDRGVGGGEDGGDGMGRGVEAVGDLVDTGTRQGGIGDGGCHVLAGLGL